MSAKGSSTALRPPPSRLIDRSRSSGGMAAAAKVPSLRISRPDCQQRAVTRPSRLGATPPTTVPAAAAAGVARSLPAVMPAAAGPAARPGSSARARQAAAKRVGRSRLC